MDRSAPNLTVVRPVSGTVALVRAQTIARPTAPVRAPSSEALDFDGFYRAEFPAMVALARAICGSHEQAEELAQEAMSRAHRNWHKISKYQKPGAWLRRVTINLAISRRRRLGREIAMLRLTASRQGTDATDMPAGPDDDVWDAVRQLPLKQRAAIALFYQEDRSTAEIADALGCSISTATSHLSQARKRLALLLDEQPVEGNR